MVARSGPHESLVEPVTQAVLDGAKPESRNGAITLGCMAGILATMFVGITVLALALGVLSAENETVVSQIARGLFGTGVIYYLIQAATALILILAANTSFADFPRLSSLLARDRFIPRQFANLGERLAWYSRTGSWFWRASRRSSLSSSAVRRMP